MSQDFDWSNDLTLRFVEVLSTERALWDFNDPRYKMKQKVNDAWSRISAQMNIPVDILKNKKKILMASWRPLFRKKMASIRSGADEDEIFQPVWFAYDAMESFLGGVYDIDGTMNTEYLQVYEEPAASSPSSPSQQSDDASPPITIKKENQGKSEHNKVKILSTIKRKRIAEYNYDESQQNVNYSFDPLNPVTPGAQQNPQHRFHRSRAPRSEEEDECDIYAKLLARKLRRYPARMRDSIMFKIDGLLLDNPYPDEEASPCPSYAQPPYS